MDIAYDPWDDVDRRIDIERAIGELDEWERQMLCLWTNGYTQAEIGEMFDITQRSVSYDLGRIIKYIRVRVALV